ncbi:family 16 glycosylhydrolase [Pedobacter cryophilus]|uniref:Glycosyl hydrolase family protein n=1 Tax=Pedobacter cryophilus TaxID=2571271 RepID=A0A4U1C5G1_9SPHI|nr:family 16 glycosylhydrolase [Pedobacter cryophilus]TKC00619.1 glycosyl hydrolase family protein [Pedobacter cryophilus]
MGYFKNIGLIFLLFISTSCKKADSGKGSSQTAPTNLVITATPNTNGSGNVSFKATADNAVAYTYELGNGTIKSAATGIIDYQYTLVGNNTYTVSVTATSSTGLTLKKSIDVTVNVIAGVASLVWSDEFNTDGAPDATKWGYDLGTGSNGWGNAELQYYTNRPENSIVQNGVLKIKLIKENYSGSTYTSARLLSKDKFAFTYGKVEVRAKFPTGTGTWPAIWMLGSNINTVPWPACGEIDIVEHLGRDLNKIYATLHYPGRSGGSADGGTRMIANATSEFHIYTLEWTASSIRMLADGQVVHTVNNSSSIPFNHDFFFILNMAMGGNFGGAVDPAITNATMEVDYIRVYK